MTSPSTQSDLTRRTSRRGLSYHRRGHGPAIVFLHGWCLNGEFWTHEEGLLGDDYDVITPDLAGLGRSDSLAGPYSLERHAADVNDLLDELDLTDVTVVGFAFGATVALTSAASSMRIGGLLLVGTPCYQKLPSRQWVPSMMRDWPEYARRSARAICIQPQSEATTRWLESMSLIRLLVASDVVTLVVQSRQRAADVRMLFVHGGDDAFSPVDSLRESLAAAPSAVVEVIPDCGHLVPVDQRAAFLQMSLQSFLSART